MGVRPITSDIVSQTCPCSLSSHFIDEHDGSSIARACSGESLSTELACARSIWVIAPRGAYTCR